MAMPTACSSSRPGRQKNNARATEDIGRRTGYQMRMVRLLALLPFAAMLIGPFFVNRVEPTILGMPFLLAWFVIWIVLSTAIMALIYRFDPANRDDHS
jgi:Protein of unknown function (DUF3311)